MSTPLQTLAAQADQLWKEITRADEILLSLDRPSGRPSARTEARDKDLGKIRQFFEEARDRFHLMEEYMMLIKPEDKSDALIQIAAAHQILKENATPPEVNGEPSSRQRLALRMLAEATVFLEREGGTSISTTFGGLFGWKAGISWEEVLAQSRALLDRYHGQIEKAA